MRELARKANLSASTISMLENGDRDVTLSTLTAICKVLGTKPSNLLTLASKLGNEASVIDKMRKQVRLQKEELEKLRDSIAEKASKLLTQLG